MTLWELAACIEGYNLAHGGEEQMPGPMSAEEFDAMIERHETMANKTLH